MLWQQVTVMVNDKRRVHRPWQKVRRKWFEMKSSALQYRCTAGQSAPAGDTSPPTKPWFWDDVMNIVGKESDIDTGNDSTCSGESFGYPCDEKKEEPCLLSASNDVDDPVPPVRSGPSGGHDGQLHMAVSQTETMEPASSEQQAHPRPVTTGPTDQLTTIHQKRKQPQQECKESAKKRKILKLVTKEIERVQVEKKKHLLEIEILEVAKVREEKKTELLNVQLTNAKMEQLKLYYELRKTESELGLSGEMGVDKIFKPK